jgi:alpha-1,2-mannosyltransferase
MLPLGLTGRPVAIPAVAALSLAGFALICVITMKRLRIDRRLGWFLALGAISLQPVFTTFELGQVNLALMALVMLDCLVLPPRYRGLGVGLAAGVKIVPGIFVLYFVLRRDWRAVAQSGATFVATVLVSIVVMPQETIAYWTHLTGAAARTGDTISGVNQSLPAVVARLMHDRYPPTVVVALVSLCGVALAVMAARKELGRDHPLAALVCIAIGGLLASPVSWAHHYVWAVPALIILFVEKRTVAAAVGAAIFYVAPYQNIAFGNGVELTYGPWELLLSSAYPLAAVLWLTSRLFIRGAIVPLHLEQRIQRLQPNGSFLQETNQRQVCRPPGWAAYRM